MKTIKCSRPWGRWIVLAEGEGFKVKILKVQPKKSLSLQRHKHREEHWFFLGKNKRVFIKKGEWHQLKNNTNKLMQILEVQLGDYLEEDDIERKNEN